MDLSLSEEQEQLRDVFTGLLAKESTVERVREAEPLGFDAALWSTLTEVGTVGVGVAESNGGGGAGMLELGLIAEACGRVLAPVPFVEAPVAARVLALFPESAAPALRGVLDDGRVTTFLPRLAKGGVATLAPFGAVAEVVVALDGDDLVVAEVEPSGASPANLGCVPLADVPLRVDKGALSSTVLASGAEAERAFETAQAEWQALMAAALSGLAARSLEIGVEYVKARHQFGVPIGSFQSVAHKLADVATEVDGSTLLWQESTWALDEGEPNAIALAEMALIFASETAERTSGASLHFHGGYGFMLEYDIQLYVRRAKAWPLAAGSRVSNYQRLADQLFGPVQVGASADTVSPYAVSPYPGRA